MADLLTVAAVGSYLLTTVTGKAQSSAERGAWKRLSGLVTGTEASKAFEACVSAALGEAMRTMGVEDVEFAVASLAAHVTADRLQSVTGDDPTLGDLALWRRDRDYGPITMSLWEAFVTLIGPLFEPLEGHDLDSSAASAWFPEDRRDQITVPAMADALLSAFQHAANQNLADNGPLQGLAQALAIERAGAADARQAHKLDELLGRPASDRRIELTLESPYLFQPPARPHIFKAGRMNSPLFTGR